MGFVDAETVSLPQRGIWMVEGLPGTGKTAFGLSGKSTVAHLRFDVASEGALRKAREGRPGAIKVSTFDFERPRTSKNERNQAQKFSEQVMELAEETYNAFAADYRHALTNGFQTVLVDDAVVPWEVLRIARFGKVEQVPQGRYEWLNWEFKKLLKESLAANVNLISLHPLKEEWLDGKDSSGNRTSTKTGRYVPQGWSKTSQIAAGILRLFRAGDVTDPAKTPVGTPTYGHFCAQFLKCNENGALVGQVVDFNEYAEMGITNTFGVIMSLVYEDTSPDSWL